ncbi:CFC_HP_G0025080.mRNA.1.CDS.1 [Saccharomyces cerevisiae]|nr:CFC_HP_G0025080.mRNA.1.CDS.1 [Saccharomyces cerevisiae]CAI6944605.1 CFC_HP_G0025080.mRNA.1.CDS.1 [Saccharomyces cerevisiae]
MSENNGNPLDLSSLRNKISSNCETITTKGRRKPTKARTTSIGCQRRSKIDSKLSDDDDAKSEDRNLMPSLTRMLTTKGFKNDLQNFMKNVGFDQHKTQKM